MSDARSQSRLSERRARQREIRRRIGRDPNTSLLRHVGTADDKFRRALHEVKKLADAYAAGKPNFDTDYANQVLSYALSETQFLTRRWKRACEREKRHGRAAGASGVTLEQLEKYGRPAEWCWFMSDGLRYNPSYAETNPSRPGKGLKVDYRVTEVSAFTIWHGTLRNPIHAPYRRVNIRKDGSRKTRPVDVAEPWDNIAETQLNAVTTPFLTRNLSESVLAFRAGCGTEDALAKAIQTAERRDLHHWLVVDLKNAYGSVNHRRLKTVLTKLIPGPHIPDVIMKTISPKRRPSDPQGRNPRGLPQGSPVSPVLFNAYADWYIDKVWSRKYPQWPMLRYADDIVILTQTRKDAAEAQKHLQKIITSAGFEIQRQKTRSVNMKHGELIWLGHQISRRSGEYTIEVPERSWQKLDERLAMVRTKKTTEDSTDIRAVIDGFIDYHAPAWTTRTAKSALNRLEEIIEKTADTLNLLPDDIRRWKKERAEKVEQARRRWSRKIYNKPAQEPSLETRIHRIGAKRRSSSRRVPENRLLSVSQTRKTTPSSLEGISTSPIRERKSSPPGRRREGDRGAPHHRTSSSHTRARLDLRGPRQKTIVEQQTVTRQPGNEGYPERSPRGPRRIRGGTFSRRVRGWMTTGPP